MSFFMIRENKKLKETDKLMLVLKLIDWSKCQKYLKNIHKNDISL